MLGEAQHENGQTCRRSTLCTSSDLSRVKQSFSKVTATSVYSICASPSAGVEALLNADRSDNTADAARNAVDATRVKVDAADDMVDTADDMVDAADDMVDAAGDENDEQTKLARSAKATTTKKVDGAKRKRPANQPSIAAFFAKK